MQARPGEQGEHLAPQEHGVLAGTLKLAHGHPDDAGTLLVRRKRARGRDMRVLAPRLLQRHLDHVVRGVLQAERRCSTAPSSVTNTLPRRGGRTAPAAPARHAGSVPYPALKPSLQLGHLGHARAQLGRAIYV